MRIEVLMTTLVYDTSAPRRPINLTVNTDLLRRAKERKINVSSVLEAALAEELRVREEAEWKKESKEAIDTYNKKIREVGLFSDEMRSF
jgi:antitoxin CcdA